MKHGLPATLAACVALVLTLSTQVAAADAIDLNVRQLEPANSYKVRLAAAAALAKSRDARAVLALAAALRQDTEVSIRQLSAIALETMIDARTAPDARELGLDALDEAARADADPRVRDTCARALKTLAGLRRKGKPTPSTPGNKPPVFVTIDPTTDQSKRLPTGAGEGVTQLLKKGVERTGYATSWPGGLPTAADLEASQSRAFVVAGTVKKIDVKKVGAKTQIACTVAVRVAPWMGKDGGERWEANRAASASGSATATTGNRERDVQGGVRDCVESVAEEVTSRQVLPFLKKVASAKTP